MVIAGFVRPADARIAKKLLTASLTIPTQALRAARRRIEASQPFSLLSQVAIFMYQIFSAIHFIVSLSVRLSSGGGG